MELLLTAGRWIVGERVLIRSRQALVTYLVVIGVALGWGLSRVRTATHFLRSAGPMPTVPPDQGDTKFGLPLARRKEIFAAVASNEPHARAEGARSFHGPGMAWSAEDHRGSFERTTTLDAANRFHVSLTVVYLVLDEGIREKWPGPDGEPLRATTVPLHPRRNYGW